MARKEAAEQAEAAKKVQNLKRSKDARTKVRVCTLCARCVHAVCTLCAREEGLPDKEGAISGRRACQIRKVRSQGKSGNGETAC